MGYRSTNQIFITSSPVEVGPQAAGRGAAPLGLSAAGVPKKIVAQRGTCALGLGGSNATVRRAPQSGTATLGLGALVQNDSLAFSGSFTHVTITRDYRLATNELPVGVVYFTPSAWLVNNRVTVAAAQVAAPVSGEGQITIDLAANTDPGTAPPDSYYLVTEQIVGQPQRRYKVAIPYDQGLSVDLSTLPVIP